MRTIGYKIAIINNANLNHEFVQVGVDAEEKPVMSRQFVQASKRLSRAINKARQLSMGNKAIMLFGIREDGTHFPVSLKRVKWEAPKGNGCNSWMIVEPGNLTKQAQAMRTHQALMANEIRANA